MNKTFEEKYLNIFLKEFGSFFGTNISVDFLCEYLNIENLDGIYSAYNLKENVYVNNMYILTKNDLWLIKSDKSVDNYGVNEFKLQCWRLSDIKSISYKIDDLDILESNDHKSKFNLCIIFYDNYKIDLEQISYGEDSNNDFSLKNFYKVLLNLK